MQSIARRKWLTALGAAGLGVFVAREGGLWGEGDRSERGWPDAQPARARIQQRHLPNVELVTQDGKTLRFYQDLVKDKKVVVNFIDTRFQSDSTKVMGNLAEVHRFFGRRVGADIFMNTITCNPKQDTPAVLKAWATRYAAGPGWQFLTGKPADIETLRTSVAPRTRTEKFDSRYTIAKLVIGVEPEMRWSQHQAGATPRVIAHHMLLDFGEDPADANAPPVWNCERLINTIA
ncbi:MAG: SCO family protein [Streptomycetales bacterium]